MAPPHNNLHLSTPLPLSLSTEHRRRRCSKAQMCFFNILHIISVFPTPHDDEISENKELVVDLRLRPPTEPQPFDGQNCVFEKHDRRKSESVVAKESESAVEEERATEHSEISHVGDQSSGIDYNGVTEEEKPKDEGYLGLLIEAAKLILGDDSEQDRKPPRSSKSKYVEATVKETAAARGGAKRKQQCWTAAAEAEWYAEFEDTSPVVKSKRGRNQVLPFKYRDSVVEPLVRWTSSTATCKSISNAAKRRSK